MNIGIVGGRDFTDFYCMVDFITKLITIVRGDVIVSGGARGADALAEQFAKRYKLKTLIFPADWDAHGKQAGFIRNASIIENSNMIFAFPTLASKGTWDTIRKAEEKGIPCHICKTYT